jgi:hypothetical protein
MAEVCAMGWFSAKMSSIWAEFKSNVWLRIALAAAALSYFVPHKLSAVGFSPPIGVYIAVMGGLAAAVTFRKEPSSREKALWILAITFLTFSEIRNLYVADDKHTREMGLIVSSLDLTNQGLRQTLTEARGGGGYPYVVGIGPNSAAYPPSDDGSGKWALFVQDSDIEPLQGVMLEIQECSFGNASMAVMSEKYRHRVTLQIGTVVSSKYGSHPINYSVFPGCYMITMTTRVSRFTETLKLGPLGSGKQESTVLDANNKVIVPSH